MAEAFKVGDVVQLKSGGPVMTVETILLGGDVKCQWFARTTLKHAIFEPSALVRAKKPKDEKA